MVPEGDANSAVSLLKETSQQFRGSTARDLALIVANLQNSKQPQGPPNIPAALASLKKTSQQYPGKTARAIALIVARLEEYQKPQGRPAIPAAMSMLKQTRYHSEGDSARKMDHIIASLEGGPQRESVASVTRAARRVTTKVCVIVFLIAMFIFFLEI